jgi:hypothetical protein
MSLEQKEDKIENGDIIKMINTFCEIIQEDF